MGDGTEQNLYTREDVLRLIEENGGKAEGLDLSGKWFEGGIDLRDLNLQGIILVGTVFSQVTQGKLINTGNPLKDAELWGELWGGSSGGARLSRSNLERADLRDAHLEGAGWWDAHLEGASLWDAHLEGSDFSGAHLEGADLNGAYLQEANLVCAHLEGADLCGANLEGADLSGTHFQGAYLSHIKSEDNIEFDDVDWGNYILGIENFGDYFEAAKVYRCLKQWYTEHGMYDIAGEFFFREMTAKRKALKWWPNPTPRVWSKFLSLICGYGERPLRVIAWAASVVVGLALTYFLIGLTWEWSAFWNSLYFSAVSFTALGYGSWLHVTNDWIKGIGAFESFVGVFSIALFLITFVRKMIR